MDHFDGDALSVSKYFRRFDKLQKEYPGLLQLRGDNVLVEKLPPVELKTKSGILLGVDVATHKATTADAMTEFGLVLMVGPGQILDDGTTLDVACEPGQVVLLPQNTYWYSQFGHIADYKPYTIGRIRDGQIGMWFQDYQHAFEVLNGNDERQT